jgi:hypothetical protein
LSEFKKERNKKINYLLILSILKATFQYHFLTIHRVSFSIIRKK